ncbi:MAG: MotE family protein [Oligoflexales bacterium]
MNDSPRLTNVFKLLLGVKITALILLAALYLGWLYLGERKSHGQNGENQDVSELENSTKSQKLARFDSRNRSRDSKNFLESLLTLPELDVNKSSKDEIGRYLTLIDQAKQQVAEKMGVLEHKLSQLRDLENSLDAKIARLDEERQFFAQTIQQEKKIQKERLEDLVDLYEKMEPKKAAPVFEAMDKDLVIAIFKKMKKKQVTKVLESMQTDKSVMISEYFGRVGSAREYDLLKEMNRSLQMAFNDCKELPDKAK